ncbi:hypothetical protein HA50_16450 [Pantoea cypripedii]|uniref:Uncharacterized protein n=1 Tax=Pantoea cypripedii TaxID=55209 RepID=A0A1X1EYI9_PANCY|nr:hypothetical protein HA50_16450 [Pantoea cypripedii]
MASPQSHFHATTAVAAPDSAQPAQPTIGWSRQTAFACLLGQQTGFALEAKDLTIAENLTRSASIGHGKLQCYDVKIIATGQLFEISTYPASAIIASGHEDRLPAIASCVNNERSKVGMVTLPSESGDGEENFVTVSFNRQGLISCAELITQLNHQQKECVSVEDIVSNYMSRLNIARAMVARYENFHNKIAVFGDSAGIKAHGYLNPSAIFLSDKLSPQSDNFEVDFEPSTFFYRFLQQAEIKSLTKTSSINCNQYMSREVIWRENYTSKADSYSFGAIFMDLFNISYSITQLDDIAIYPVIEGLVESRPRYRTGVEEILNLLKPRYTLASLGKEYLNSNVIDKNDAVLPPEELAAMAQSQINYISALCHHLAASGDETHRFLVDALIGFMLTKNVSLAGMQNYFTHSQEISNLKFTGEDATLLNCVQEMLQNKCFDACALLFLPAIEDASQIENCTFSDCYLDNLIGTKEIVSTLTGSHIKHSPESQHNKPTRVWLKDFNMKWLTLTGTEQTPVKWLVQSLGQTTAPGNHWENVELYLNQCGKDPISEINFSHSQFTNVVMSSCPANIRHGQPHSYPQRDILQSNFSDVAAKNLTWTGLAFRQGCNFSGFSAKNLTVSNTTLNDAIFGDYQKEQITLAAEMFNNAQIRSRLEPGTGAEGNADFLVFLASIADKGVQQDFAQQMCRHILAGGGELLSHSALYLLLNHIAQQGYEISADIERCCVWALSKLYRSLRTKPFDQQIGQDEQAYILNRYLPLLKGLNLLSYQVWVNQKYNQLLPEVKAAYLAIPEVKAAREALLCGLLGAETDDGSRAPIYFMPYKDIPEQGFHLSPDHLDAILKKRSDILVSPEPFDVTPQGADVTVSFIGQHANRVNEIFLLNPWLVTAQQSIVKPDFKLFQPTTDLSSREATRLAQIDDHFRRCAEQTARWGLKLHSMDDYLLLMKVLAPYFTGGSSATHQRDMLSANLLLILRSRMMDTNGLGGLEEAKQAYLKFSRLSPNLQLAVAALSLAELFTRLSSVDLSGSEDNSPPAIRKLARYFMLDVERLWPQLAESFGDAHHTYSTAHYDEQQKKLVYEKSEQIVSTLAHWQDTLYPPVGVHAGVAGCTAILTDEIKIRVESCSAIDNTLWEMMRLF